MGFFKKNQAIFVAGSITYVLFAYIYKMHIPEAK